MPRTAMLFALILTLLTGLVLGQMSSLGQKPIQFAATSDSGAAETARAFYRAINVYLQTGEADGLERLLAPGFVGHVPHTAGDESADAFIQYLESMRLTFPGLQLKVSDVSAQAGTVAVDVTLTGDTDGTFIGLPFEAGAGTSGYEVLRVEGQQIAERWGSREMPPLLRPVFGADMAVPTDTILEPRIERLAFEPHGSLELIDQDGFILIPESGAITWQVASNPVDRSDPGTAPSSPIVDPEFRNIVEAVTLEVGQPIEAPAGIRMRILNAGTGTATALAVSIRQAQFSMGGVPPYKVFELIGIERTLVAGGGVASVPGENSNRSISLGKVVLAPGSVIPRHAAGDAELLVVIDGQIDVSVDQGLVVWNQPGKRIVVIRDMQTVSASQGVRANPGAVVEYQAGPDKLATLWILTVTGNAAR